MSDGFSAVLYTFCFQPVQAEDGNACLKSFRQALVSFIILSRQLVPIFQGEKMGMLLLVLAMFISMPLLIVL
ncbi:CDP-diacylglycerol-serine O-phosphatidyltransferase [Neisseria wadsworthii 9715]|uniref:CDP-diacylglycerol-serine O-phosphatidyltransferase n=2 Tax=Neisseria TaxID=482 RepID=G4CTE4_9NEIS|nr:CDP-diacylglycerol-serine O-phosphatidyltransferase [Neisseria wadsworthii 9715]